jgi:hypothetical protein
MALYQRHNLRFLAKCMPDTSNYCKDVATCPADSKDLGRNSPLIKPEAELKGLLPTPHHASLLMRQQPPC